MTFFRNRRAFSLLELLIALSIIIIMTTAATLYLGDIIFKAKVAKASDDMQTIVTAVTLHDAELPAQLIDTGLVGSSAASRVGNSNSPVARERVALGALVGTYLLSTPVDPWQASYKMNSYSGWVKTLAEDYNLGGTSKYALDIVAYYLPESLFLTKVRAKDLNGNTVLDTGDEINLYFSKSVRCNIRSQVGGGQVASSAVTYNGTNWAAYVSPYGIPDVDVHTSYDNGGVAAEKAKNDGSGYNPTNAALPVAGGAAIHAGGTTWALGHNSTWTAHDLSSFAPGARNAWNTAAAAVQANFRAKGVDQADALNVSEAGGIERLDYIAAGGATPNLYGFHRPAENMFYASCFSRNLKFWCNRTCSSHGSDVMNLDIGYEVYLPTDQNIAHRNYQYAYACWESSEGYMSYKSAGEKLKLYLQVQSVDAAVRTLTWKSLVD